MKNEASKSRALDIAFVIDADLLRRLAVVLGETSDALVGSPRGIRFSSRPQRGRLDPASPASALAASLRNSCSLGLVISIEGSIRLRAKPAQFPCAGSDLSGANREGEDVLQCFPCGLLAKWDSPGIVVENRSDLPLPIILAAEFAAS